MKKRLQQKTQQGALRGEIPLQDSLDIAKRLMASRQYSSARAVMRSLLLQQPENVDVIKLAARIESKAGNVDDAVALLDSLHDIDESAFARGLWLSSGWLADEGQYSAAQERLIELLRLQGSNVRVHRRLARLLNNQGQRIAAARHLRAITAIGEASERELFAMNEYRQPLIDESLPPPDLSGPLTPSALAQAKRLYEDKEIDKAIALTEQLHRQFPQSTAIAAFALRLRALNQRANDWDAFRQSLRTMPTGIEAEPEYWNAIGRYLQAERQHEQAARCFYEAISRDPTDRDSHAALAGSLMVLRKPAAADFISRRHKLLVETGQLAARFGTAPGTLDDLNQMAQLLRELGRPLEAIGWQTVALQRAGNTPEDRQSLKQERQRVLDERSGSRQRIGIQRPSKLSTNSVTPIADEPFLGPSDDWQNEWLALGVQPNRWLLPSLAELVPNEASKVANNAIDDGNPRVALPTPSRLAQLHDVAASVGIDFTYQRGSDSQSTEETYLHQMTGGGIGVIDYDLDGRVDLYLGQGGGDALDDTGSLPNPFYRNHAGATFANVALPAMVDDRGYAQGIGVCDLNQDGFPDLLVANIGVNLFYRNNGDGTFTRMNGPDETDDQPGAWTTSIVAGDLSGDGLPEVIAVNYVDDASAFTTPCTPEHEDCNPSKFHPASDQIASVTRDGTWSQWDTRPDWSMAPNYGFAAILANFDGAAGNDLFVANDTLMNQFWKSIATETALQQSDKFTLVESARLSGCGFGIGATRNGCMGIAAGDVDRNGMLDLHVTNYWNQSADLFLLHRDGLFSNGTISWGLHDTSRETVGWGTQAVDLDRNGWLDLVVMNGHVANQERRGRPFKMMPQVFQNNGKVMQLVSAGEMHDPYWRRPALGRTLAVLDFNDDGRPDLVSNHLDQPLALLENRTEPGRWMALELVGRTSERDAIGAKVVVNAGGQTWSGWQIGGDGFLCTNQSRIDIGLGDAQQIDSISVAWPDGHLQTVKLPDGDLPNVDATYLVIQSDDESTVAWRR